MLLLIGVYAGYFGAAQGIVLIAALTTMFDGDLQRSNAVKNVLQGVSNGAAGVVFALAGFVAWATGHRRRHSVRCWAASSGHRSRGACPTPRCAASSSPSASSPPS